MRILRACALAAPSLLITTALVAPAQAQQADDATEVFALDPILVESAEDQLRQAPGVSTITEEDLERLPPTNDVAEFVRRMPGANLSGNTTTGQRGNQRQIDLRGMGPENTLILIDGRPALSRNSVRMGRSGERDTRGDSNWVPPEMVERIEVIRGPAAARYGSGASGGVVNIITKVPDERSVETNLYYESPESDDEGAIRRGNVIFAGPLGERLTYRGYLSRNETGADAPDINAPTVEDEEDLVYAGREGVTNEDARLLLRYRASPANRFGVELGFSRQGNEYAGDSLFQGVTDEVELEDGRIVDLIGEETNRIYRRTLALTHDGDYAFGSSSSYLQWENTDNTRLSEGFAGSGEGAIGSDEFVTIGLDTLTGKTEWDMPLTAFGRPQTLTFGAEYRGEWMDDPVSVEPEIVTDLPGTDTDPDARDVETDAQLLGLYVENNIELSDTLTLTPGLRADWHSEADFNVSPSLNAAWQVTPQLMVKGGVSRAFKAPNLYQLNPNWIYYTRGRGCPVDYPSLGGGCYILGNPDLDPETSINKEIGVSYTGTGGLVAGLTFFHNDYRDRISASLEPAAVVGDTQVFRWDNTADATIRGLEANLTVPVTDRLTWVTNATALESENEETGQPLSLVPDYTINSHLDFAVTPAWDVSLQLTHYGETDASEVDVRSGAEIEDPQSREPYTLVGLSTNYALSDRVTLRGGVKNLFDERVLRSGEGAESFNEPGRSVFVGLGARF